MDVGFVEALYYWMGIYLWHRLRRDRQDVLRWNMAILGGLRWEARLTGHRWAKVRLAGARLDISELWGRTEEGTWCIHLAQLPKLSIQHPVPPSVCPDPLSWTSHTPVL